MVIHANAKANSPVEKVITELTLIVRVKFGEENKQNQKTPFTPPTY